MTKRFWFFKKYFLRFWDTGFIFRNVFVPLAVLSLYLFFLSRFLSVGVSQNFSRDLLTLTFSVWILVGLLVFILWKLKIGKLEFRKAEEKITGRDLVLVLLPLTPIVQYILSNQDILSPLTSLYLLGFFVLLLSIFIIGFPILLGFLGSSRTMAAVSLSLSFLITNMAALSLQFSWFEVGSLKIQLTVFSAIFLVAWFLWDLNLKRFLYLLVVVYFISNSIVQAFAPHENKAGEIKSSFPSNKMFNLVGDRQPPATPNIYLLIYDAYVHNETMLQYGIDNGAQESYLEEQGFKLYPKTYSVAAASLSTMSRIYNASAEIQGNMRSATSGNGAAHRLLRNFGYQLDAIFPTEYFFRGVGSSFDNSFPTVSLEVSDSSFNLITGAIFLGEFRFDLEFNKSQFPAFVENKLAAFNNVPGVPRFIDTHTGPGHSQNSGACLPNENELYKERLDDSNLEMRTDVDTIIENDPGAIVIIAGDHGPYLTKNCTLTESKYSIEEINRLDIQDRFGTFLAIRWPDKNFEEYDDITVLQDIFPAVFAYLFKDESLLQAKVNPVTLEPERVSGASVENGIIRGGVDDGKPLFSTKE